MTGSYVEGAAHLALVEYEDEISANLRLNETSKLGNARLIDLQPEITWDMRYQLLEFMAQAQAALDLAPASLALAVNILDRYMSLRVIHSRHFQLLGCVCLWIAAKTIDDKHNVPNTSTLAFLCARTYDENMIREMEFHVLCVLEWDILAPTAIDFVDFSVAEVARALDSDISPGEIAAYKLEQESLASKAFISRDFTADGLTFGFQEYNIVRAMSQYVCECALFSKDFIGVKPSSIAASAVAFSTTALEVLQTRGWPAVYPQGSSNECFEALVALVSRAPNECAARYSGEEQFSASQMFSAFFETYTRPVSPVPSPYFSPQKSVGYSSYGAAQLMTPERSSSDKNSSTNTESTQANTVQNNVMMPLTPENEVILHSGKVLNRNPFAS